MTRNILIFITLSLALIFVFLLDLILGSVHIPFLSVIDIFMGNSEKESWEYIIYNFRLPKAITAVIAGAGISIAGLQMQTLFNNPLADTSVLGIGHGASLGVSVFVLAAFIFPGIIPQSIQFSSWGIVLAAILGASLVLSLVLLISKWLNDTVSLLIAGIMIGFATGSVVSIFQYLSDPELLKNYIVWTFGSLAGVGWSQLQIMSPIVMVGLTTSLLIPKNMNALLLGENYAASVGVNVKQTKRITVAITSLLAGTITAFTGPIAFLGIAVPHFTRMFVKTTDHRILIPASMICGALLMLVCDIISQLPGGRTGLPINAVTSLIGAPLVLYIIIKNRRGKIGFS